MQLCLSDFTLCSKHVRTSETDVYLRISMYAMILLMLHCRVLVKFADDVVFNLFN